MLISSFTSRGGPESIISPLDFEMLISDLFGMTFDAAAVFTLELDFFYLNPAQHSVASHLQCSSKSEFQKCLMARSSCLGMWLSWLAISFYVLDASAILRIKK